MRKSISFSLILTSFILWAPSALADTIPTQLCAKVSPQDPPTELRRVTWGKKGDPLVVEELHRAAPHPVARKLVCQQKKVIEEIIFSTTGKKTHHLSYEYFKDGSFQRSVFDPYITGEALKVKTIERPIEDGKTLLVKKWFYKKLTEPACDSCLQYEEVYDSTGKYVVQRDFYTDDPQNPRLERTFYYEYDTESKSWKNVNKVKVVNHQTGFSKTVDLVRDSNIEENLKREGRLKELAIHKDFSRRRISVIDTGFDLTHPEINYKFMAKPSERIDGQDSDGNGWVDDIYGGTMSIFGEFSYNINEAIGVEADPRHKFHFSHGSHVASIALKDITSFGLFGFAGDLGNSSYLNGIAKFLKDNRVEFVNMSFGVDDADVALMTGAKTDSYHALSNLISNNPDTLFFVSAGNSGKLLGGKFKVYPASFNHDNLMVIGALNSSNLDELQGNMGEKAPFSNFSRISVDIFAPGYKVPGALLYEDRIDISGTSMASPWALNEAVRVAETYPELDTKMIRKILMLTAYFEDFENTLECKSGGRVEPETAKELGRLLMNNPQGDIYQLALQAKEKTGYYPKVADWKEKLLEFWKARSI